MARRTGSVPGGTGQRTGVKHGRKKRSRPGAGAQGGAGNPQKGNEMNTYILHAKRAIVKGLAVLVGLWFLSALAALNWPLVLALVVAENALIGAVMK